MVLVWYPIGVRNEFDAATATAMANGRGSTPRREALATAIGKSRAAAALLVMSSVVNTVVSVSPSSVPCTLAPLVASVMSCAAAAASPDFSIAVPKANEAAMTAIVSTSIALRASAAVNTRVAPGATAPINDAGRTGKGPAAPRQMERPHAG